MVTHLQRVYPAFSIEGTTRQVLQIVLFPTNSVNTNLHYICYSSSHISIAKNRASSRVSLEVRVRSNEEINYLALTKKVGGKILAISPAVFKEKLVIHLGFLLCYTQCIELRAVDRPPHNSMKHTPFASVKGKGYVFLQSVGTTIKKKLGHKEKILLEPAALIGYTATVQVSNITRGSFRATKLLSIKGPGLVFISSHSNCVSPPALFSKRSALLLFLMCMILLPLLCVLPFT